MASTTAPEAAIAVTFAGVPKKLTSLSVNVAAKASRSCTQTVSLWNWNSSSWNTISVTSISTSYAARTGMNGKASPSSYVGGPSGTVRLLVSCRRGRGRFHYSVDWTQIRFSA